MPEAAVRKHERNPDRTRRAILEAAFRVIHRHGFQGMRLDEVVEATGLTKGALYHHFPNKQALGYAVVDEIIAEMMHELWTSPLEDAEDPLQGIIDTLTGIDERMGDDLTVLGCPLNNLAQEMSPLDEGFRTRIDRVYSQWQASLEQALERAQARGDLRSEADTRRLAGFIIASISGCIGLSKTAQDRGLLRDCLRTLAEMLERLRRPS